MTPAERALAKLAAEETSVCEIETWCTQGAGHDGPCSWA